MVFSSIVFLFYFLPIFLIVYFVTPKKLKNSVLFLSGLIFYAWGEPINVIYMLLCILINYGAGRLMERADKNEKRRKLIMILAVVSSGLTSRHRRCPSVFPSTPSRACPTASICTAVPLACRKASWISAPM